MSVHLKCPIRHAFERPRWLSAYSISGYGVSLDWDWNCRDGSLRCRLDTRVVASIVIASFSPACRSQTARADAEHWVRRRRFESVGAIRPVVNLQRTNTALKRAAACDVPSSRLGSCLVYHHRYRRDIQNAHRLVVDAHLIHQDRTKQVLTDITTSTTSTTGTFTDPRLITIFSPITTTSDRVRIPRFLISTPTTTSGGEAVMFSARYPCVDSYQLLLSLLGFLQADRAFLADTDAQILDLETQIAALEHSVSLLHAARQPVQERLDSYKYPVLTLPNEIIAEIFLRFLPTYPEPPPLVGIYSPTCLTQVCHKWREIAHTTPALWRAIDLTRPFKEPSVEEAVSLSLLWIERSGACPLSIRLSDSMEPLSVFTSVISRCARWEHLTLKLDATQDLDVIPDSLPSLRELVISFSSSFPDPATQVVTLHNLPLLRTVVLDDWQDLHAVLPWSQLTSLTLWYLRSENCTSVWRSQYDPTGFQARATVSRDSDLRAVESRGPEIFMLSHRTSPPPPAASGTLPPVLLGNSESLVIEPLVSFVTKSGCQLHELNITDACVPDSENVYREVFPLIPAILVAN
ncbi:hypothetical protein R3P38DRAFT_3206006 [Favolaschia claudopus]|uniref:F-box domain-containing protein n=1 Tax=Favolaschia claudopus TaxID=2862362 RepID=A0AAW0AP29_9AGAR